MLKGVQPDEVSFVISDSLLITHSLSKVILKVTEFWSIACYLHAELALVIKPKELPAIAKTDCTGLQANFC
jgi:hypothetical protein